MTPASRQITTGQGFIAATIWNRRRKFSLVGGTWNVIFPDSNGFFLNYFQYLTVIFGLIHREIICRYAAKRKFRAGLGWLPPTGPMPLPKPYWWRLPEKVACISSPPESQLKEMNEWFALSMGFLLSLSSVSRIPWQSAGQHGFLSRRPAKGRYAFRSRQFPNARLAEPDPLHQLNRHRDFNKLFVDQFVGTNAGWSC